MTARPTFACCAAVLAVGSCNGDPAVLTDSGGVALLLTLLFFGVGALLSKIGSKGGTPAKVVVTAVRDAAEGACLTVVGSLHGEGESVTAPLTGTRGIYWHVSVFEKVRTGPDDHEWRFVLAEEQGGDLLIRDETGTARVRRGLARVLTTPTRLETSGALRSSAMKALLARHKKTATGFLGFNRLVEYTERVLVEGQRVAATGVARWEPSTEPPDAHSGYRESGCALTLVAPSSGPRVEITIEPERDPGPPSK